MGDRGSFQRAADAESEAELPVWAAMGGHAGPAGAAAQFLPSSVDEGLACALTVAHELSLERQAKEIHSDWNCRHSCATHDRPILRG